MSDIKALLFGRLQIPVQEPAGIDVGSVRWTGLAAAGGQSFDTALPGLSQDL